MTSPDPTESASQLDGFASRKAPGVVLDRLGAWMDSYLGLAVTGVRSEQVAAKISLHLERFRVFFTEAYDHERISTAGRRDVVSWQRHLSGELAPATVNSHIASLSGFTAWVSAQAPYVFAGGDPAAGVPFNPVEFMQNNSELHSVWGRVTVEARVVNFLGFQFNPAKVCSRPVPELERQH